MRTTRKYKNRTKRYREMRMRISNRLDYNADRMNKYGYMMNFYRTRRPKGWRQLYNYYQPLWEQAANQSDQDWRTLENFDVANI